MSEATFLDGSPRPGRRRVCHRVEGESRTHTAFADDCDLPKKIARLAKTGELEAALRQPPLNYGDFSNVDDYMSALMAVKRANEAFMTLSAAVRREFNNDPAQLLAAVGDPAQKEKLEELGILPSEPKAAAPAAAPAEPEEAGSSETPDVTSG